MNYLNHHSYSLKYYFLQAHRHRAAWRLPEGGGLGDWAKELKEVRSTDRQLQNSHRDVKYSVGNIVNNILIIMCGLRWVLEIWETLCKICDCLPTTLYT